MSARPQKNPVRIVLSYAHLDKGRLKRFDLAAFLQGLPKKQNWEYWSDEGMDNSDFDEEIKTRFNSADVIICMVSQYFLNSKYIKIESMIARRRSKHERILVVPVLLTPSFWEEEKWLKKLHHFPTKGYVFDKGVNRLALAKEIAEYIVRHFNQRVLPFSNPKVIYKLRRLLETSLKKDQIGILTRDSCEKARKAVPDPKIRRDICREARRFMKQKKVPYLSKEDLAAIDQKFLAQKKRKPDPENVRWVLRCAGLHPQGRADA